MNGKGKILAVDDNQGIRSALKILLPMYFSNIEILASPKSMISTIRDFRPDAVLLDMNFTSDINTGNEGLYWLGEIRKEGNPPPVVLCTAYADINLAVEGMKRGAFDFIVKPWENDRLISILQKAVSISRKESKSKVARHTTPMYWGESPTMKDLRRVVEKIAPTEASVLITGENGTGKDVLAHEIHSLSPRHSADFVGVDVGAIPETLFESELFGHVKGAFTHAIENKPGKFEAAEKGTLFLDEIGNIPFSQQAKLLRALQERSITRLGDVKSIPIDVRLICATNTNLEKAVEAGAFREDLYYRLNTITVHIPALRERPQDIVPLAKLFLDEFALKYHRSVRAISEEGKVALMHAWWAGNVRELRNCIEKAVILSDGEELALSDLQIPSAPKTQHVKVTVTSLDEAEEHAIRVAMERYSGNLTLVAKALGISRPTLYKKLKKFGI